LTWNEKMGKEKDEYFNVIYKEIREVRRHQVLASFDKVFLLLLPLAIFTLSILSYSFRLSTNGFMGKISFMVLVLYPMIFIIPLIIGIKGIIRDSVEDRFKGWISFLRSFSYVFMVPIIVPIMDFLESSLKSLDTSIKFIIFFIPSIFISSIIYGVVDKITSKFCLMFLKRIRSYLKAYEKISIKPSRREVIIFLIAELAWVYLIIVIFMYKL